MNQNQFQRNFSCPVCLQYAMDALQGQCCGVIICEKCYQITHQKYKSCPKCRKQKYKTHVSVKIRMIINQYKLQCKHGCGIKIQIRHKQNHQMICEFTKNMYNDADKFYQITKYLFKICKKYYAQLYQQSNKKTESIMKQKSIFEVIILNLYNNLKSKIQKQKYWQTVLHTKVSQNNVLLLLILCDYKKYSEAVELCTKILGDLKNTKTYYILQTLIRINQQALQKQNKNQMAEIVEILQQQINRLNKQNQIQFLRYLICLTYLIKFLHLQSNDEKFQQYVLQLSSCQSIVESACDRLYQRICWNLNLYQQNKYIYQFSKQTDNQTNNRQKIKDKLQILQDFKLIFMMLEIMQNRQYFYKLLGKTQQIYQSQIYQAQGVKISALFAQNNNIMNFVQILQYKPTEQTKFPYCLCSSQLPKNKLMLAFELMCYKMCHKKFSKIQEQYMFIMEKLQDIIADYVQESANQNEDSKYIKNRKRIQFIINDSLNKRHHNEQMNKHQQKNTFFDELQEKSRIIMNKFKFKLNYILKIIQNENIRIQNQFLIRYLLVKREARLQKSKGELSITNLLIIYFYLYKNSQLKHQSELYLDSQLSKIQWKISVFIKMRQIKPAVMQQHVNSVTDTIRRQCNIFSKQKGQQRESILAESSIKHIIIQEIQKFGGNMSHTKTERQIVKVNKNEQFTKNNKSPEIGKKMQIKQTTSQKTKAKQTSKQKQTNKQKQKEKKQFK